jgi:hypothetical protein
MKKTLYKLFAGCLLSAAITASAEAQTIYTFCGTGFGGYSGDGGLATAAEIYQPAGIRIHNGDLYFGEASNHIVRKITGGTNIISTVAGNNVYGYSGDGGAATAASLRIGTGDVIFDNSGNMYFSERYNHVIRKVNTSGIISTIAGDGYSGSTGDGGAATAATLNFPGGLALDASGNLYIADQSNHKIRKIDLATGIITTVAGTGTSGSSGDGGPATAAELDNPVGVAIDASGNLYIGGSTSGGVGLIRKVNLSTGIITTHATGGIYLSYMQFDQAGNLFAGNTESWGRVYKITPSGTVTTVAGGGSGGDGGPATAARLNTPEAVTVASNGSLLISERGDHRIRVVLPNTATITGTPTTCVGGTTTFTASIPDAAWKSGNTAVATVSATGVVTGVSAGTATITYVAGLVFGTRVVTVNAPTAPSISASGATLSVPSTFATYQWTLGGTPIAGATNNTHTATTSGTYAVNVTDAGGCSATSANFSFTTSVGDISKTNGIQLYPNPATNGQFTINIPGNINETATIIITNAVGEKVYETTANTNAMVPLQLNVPAGLYMVHATTATQQYNTKVMVK